jgi:hypothetical protein
LDLALNVQLFKLTVSRASRCITGAAIARLARRERLRTEKRMMKIVCKVSEFSLIVPKGYQADIKVVEELGYMNKENENTAQLVG